MVSRGVCVCRGGYGVVLRQHPAAAEPVRKAEHGPVRHPPGTSRNQGNGDLDLALVNAWRASAGLAPIASIDSTRFRSLDMRASKPIRLAGERRAEVVVQVFNLFNTVNLSGLGTNALAATFRVASRASAGRQAEAAVRFVW